MKKINLIIIFSLIVFSNAFSDEKNCEDIKTVKKYLECKDDPNKSLKKLNIGNTDLEGVKKKIQDSKIKKALDNFKNKKSLSDLLK